MASSIFQLFLYQKSLSVDATIMVLNTCPIIGEYVVVIFLTSLATIATVYHVKNTLNFQKRGQ